MKTLALVTGLAASLAALLPAATASAVDMKPQIAVPSPHGDGDIEGCWTADRHLYGPYKLRFCVRADGGSYRVTGGGLNCRAGLDWTQTPRGYRFTLDRASCGRRTDWSADSFTCEATYRPALMPDGEGYGPGGYGFEDKKTPKVAVPSHDEEIEVLSCRYKPSVPGYPMKRFNAVRG